MRNWLWIVLLFSTFLTAGGAEPRVLRVGIYEKPPYTVRDLNGQWDGLALDLWEYVALKADLRYELVDVEPAGSEELLAAGKLDVLLGQMAVSPERERIVNFSQAFLSEPLAGAFERSTLFPHWMDFVLAMPSHGLFSVLIAGVLGLVLFAILFWLAERKVQNSHFAGHPWQAIGSAFWFSAVTMTTVGYGDKTPMTPLGRALALVWMLFGILLISAFTATVASTVAWSRTSSAVTQLSDLARFKVGVMEGTAARSQLLNIGVPSQNFLSVDAALEALREAQVSVFVADFVTIRYELNTRRWRDMRSAVLHGSSAQMAIPVRDGLPELEAINVALLDTINEPAWQGILRRWVGDPIPQNP